jgi:hypothetical protein
MMSGDTPRMKPTMAGLRRAAEIGHHDPAAVEAVLHDTWGHMKAEQGRVYTGHVIFAHTCNREVTVLDWSFEDLSGGPWFPEQLMEFISGKVPIETEEFRLWRFEGTFRELKNGRSRFSGKVRPQRVVDRFPSSSQKRDVRPSAPRAEKVRTARCAPLGRSRRNAAR